MNYSSVSFGLCLAILASGFSVQTAHAQLQPEETVSPVVLKSPRGALWRAAMAPGWGQVYNRQYYKLPFVYAGLGGIIFSALHNNDRYLTYRHAYLYAVDPEQWSRYADDAGPFAAIIEAGQERLLRDSRDTYRRNRDLSYIGFGLFYALTVLDAYVNAHLLDFDVDENLSIRLMPGANGMPGLHARLRL